MQDIVIIDYHMGNLRSVANAFKKACGGRAKILISKNPADIASADKVVFPGQGAARDCMLELKRLKLCDCIREAVQSKPFLGICMGLQVLLDGSEESPTTACLGIYAGQVRKFPAIDAEGQRLRIPQMGWNQVYQEIAHPLWQNIEDGSRFYFANSFYADPDDHDLIAARTPYGLHFASALSRRNLFAVQFHPEKSQHAGLQLLRNFLDWQP